MRIILDTDYEQNFVDLWNPEKNYWERYIQCEKKETKPLNEEDKKIRKLDFVEENTFSKRQNGMTSEDRRLLDSNFRELGIKINEIIDYINGGTNGE